MTDAQQIAIIYHRIFHYELSAKELLRWRAGPKLLLRNRGNQIVAKAVLKTPSDPTISALNEKKLKIAQRAAGVLQVVPSIQCVGVTGSLAMNNAKDSSDIDLMIITTPNSLWSTRLLSLLILFFAGFKLRRAQDPDEKDRLCLNFWIDETNLSWDGPRNAYIAHEISQVIPLVNKRSCYEQWLLSNAWIHEYWPRATKKVTTKRRPSYVEQYTLFSLVESFMYYAQLFYMNHKRTRENVSSHHAYFHPFDWGQKVTKELKRRGVVEL